LGVKTLRFHAGMELQRLLRGSEGAGFADLVGGIVFRRRRWGNRVARNLPSALLHWTGDDKFCRKFHFNLGAIGKLAACPYGPY
jgi:hypothetical protein